MNIRLQSRVIILNSDNSKVLLVRNAGKQFWYVPGGGVEGDEDLRMCAVREIKEETGLDIELGKLLYAQELHDGKTDTNHVEFIFVATLHDENSFNPDHQDTDTDGIEEMKWFSQAEVAGLTVYPTRLKDSFWRDIVSLRQRDDPFIGVFR